MASNLSWKGQRESLGTENLQSQRRSRIWLCSLVLLPYASYGALVIMLGLWLTALAQRGQQVWQLCTQRGFGWLGLGLIISSCFAWDRGESFLQLINFLPFFLFFGVLATVPAVVAQPVAKLESLARWLLLSAVPMNLLAIVEYGLKFPAVIPQVRASPLPEWLLTWLYEPDYGHRAHSVFSHPNGLSAYLVVILGLGLGLVLKDLQLSKKRHGQQIAQIAAVAIAIAAIFCTGSRNGLLIVLVLVAIALYAARHYRWIMLLGLFGSGAIAAAVLGLGIGGRSLSLELLTRDPRVGVWQLAWEMIQQRPWLGWGFAALRLRYEPGSIPDYDIIFHAHNLWLYLASEAGIPIMVGFCVVVGTLYYNAVNVFIRGKLPADQRAILLGYLLAFASCLLFSLFDVTIFDARTNILGYGLLAGLHILTNHADESWP